MKEVVTTSCGETGLYGTVIISRVHNYRRVEKVNL